MEWSFVSAFLVVVPISLGVLLWVTKRKSLGWIAIVLTPVPFVVLIITGTGADRIRIAVRGYQFSWQGTGSEPELEQVLVRIGGNSSVFSDSPLDDLVVDRLPANALRLRATREVQKGAREVERFSLSSDLASLGPCIVRHASTFVGQVPLHDGDQIHALEGKQRVSWTFRREPLIAGVRYRLERLGAVEEIPNIKPGFLWSPSATAASIDASPAFCIGKEGGQLFALPLQKGTRIDHSHGVSSEWPWLSPVPILGEHGFGLYSLSRRKAKDGRLFQAQPLRGALFDRVTFSPLPSSRRSEPVLRLSVGNPVKSSVELRDSQRAFSLNVSSSNSSGAPAVRLGGPRLAVIDSDPTVIIFSGGFEYFSAWSRSKGPYGSSAALGADTSLIINIVKLGPPFFTMLQMLTLPLVAFTFFHKYVYDFRVSFLLWVTVYLSDLRAACAWCATLLPPQSEASLSIAQVLIFLAPASVVTAWSLSRSSFGRPPNDAQEPKLCSFIAACFLLSVLPLLHTNGIKGGRAALITALVGFGILLALRIGMLLEGKAGRTEWIVKDVMANGVSYRVLIVLAGGAHLLRFLLWFGGAGESIALGVLGGRIQLSMIFTPMFIGLIGLAYATLWREQRESVDAEIPLRRFTLAVALILGGHIGCAILVRDLGLFVTVIPVVLLIACTGLEIWVGVRPRVASAIQRPTDTRNPLTAHYALFLPALVVASALLTPILFPNFSKAQFVKASHEYLVGDDIDDAESFVTEEKRLRLLQWVSPDKLRSMGTRASEGMAQHLAVMEDYLYTGARNWGSGAGYLSVPVSHIRATALSDNACVIYVIAQFGLLGAVGIMGVYTLHFAAIPPWPWQQGVASSRMRTGWVVAFLCLGTLACTSIFMFGANALVLPFTGKNVYYLGLNSVADAIEVSVLLLLAAFGIGISRGESDAQL